MEVPLFSLGFVMERDWLSLRCNSSKTKMLATSLSGFGLSAWTPIQCRMKRVPRSSVRRKVSIPFLPSFVFLPADEVKSAINIRNTLKCPNFSIMKVMGKVALFPESSLDNLKNISDEKPIVECDCLVVGAYVKILASGFEGICGTIVGKSNQKGDFLVEINSRSNSIIIIPSFLLKEAQA